jgi:hypothetical protein
VLVTGCPPATPAQDSDDDGVVDTEDNCPNVANPNQADADNDGTGDACEGAGQGDADDDGVLDADDNCVNVANPDQADSNNNGIGDACEDLDADDDGVPDEDDACPNTPADVDVNDSGCPIGDPASGDTDGDGVFDNIDQCDETPAGVEVDANGCPDTDDDGVPDNLDECPDTPAGETVDDDGCTIRDPDPDQVCGNDEVEGNEQCDDGNTTSGDGCSSTCRTEVPGLGNDFCADPTAVQDGTGSFSNVGANTDGPDGGDICEFFGRSTIESDVWFCYTATCTGNASASVCGSEFDTKMAVYSGCGCPTAEPLDCSDDDCGSGVENVQSRVTWQATQGQAYMIRVGGFIGEQGDGRLSIRCGGADVCGGSANNCTAESADGTPGCSDAACCNSVCDVDQFCCDLEWDDFCADEAEGLCDGQFAACAAGTGGCGSATGAPGCSNADCCNNVCERDPYCCITEWDDNCANEANAFCALACGARAGDCFAAHDTAGCNIISCCQSVCPEDPFCCTTEWDASCVSAAMTVCDQP